MIKETYLDVYANEMVIVYNEDGSYWSGLKSTWDELEAQREQSGTL